jgi:NAD(P)-dependent dehydrogenase (short-subunit alcohol dehydrogenase family)
VPKSEVAVVGVSEHSGWAILVTAAVEDGAPVVVDRRRVPLIDKGVPAQPHEHDTTALAQDEAESLLRTVTRSIGGCAATALDFLATDLAPRYRVSALVIREPTLDHAPTITESRQSSHVRNRADGMLYHTALCKAASQRKWNVVLHRRGEEVARAAEVLRATPEDIERFLDDLKRTLGPPWSAEHRNAFAAAIGQLDRRRLRRLA